MIKVEDNMVALKGNTVDLMHDFSILVHTCVEKNIFSRELLLDMVNEFAVSSREILKKSLIEEIDKMDNIGDALNLLGQIENDRRFK